MGLDMYLLSRSKKHSQTGHATGACGGLFPMTISTGDNTIEIGYWRKNYRLADYLSNMLFEDGNDNLVKKEMSKEQIISTIDFAKNELASKDYDNGWYDDSEWKRTIDIFKDALNRYEEGEHILYEQWY